MVKFLVLVIFLGFINDGYSQVIVKQEIVDSTNGVIVQIIEDNKKFYIKWNNELSWSSEELNYPFTHELLGKDSNYYYLEYSCGAPCWGLRLLPIKRRLQSINFLYPISHSNDFRYIVTGDTISQTRLNIFDIKRKRKAVINIKKKIYPGIFYFDYLEVLIENDQIWVKYPDGEINNYNIEKLTWKPD